MNKLLPVIVLFLFARGVQAQCSPDMSQTEPGIHPTAAEGLAPATVSIPYSQTLTIIIPHDTTVEIVPGFPTTVTITKAKVNNVAGLPAGFTYACNPSNCEFPGGETHCAVITGTATAGQEGSYPLKIYVTYYAGSLTADDTVDTYTLEVGALGVFEVYKTNTLKSRVSPNPFTNNADVNFTAVSAGDIRISVYNLLGRAVRTEQVRAVPGENTYTLKGGSLQPGIYLVEVSDGRSKSTQKLIKQ
jgi:hypothetical protein